MLTSKLSPASAQITVTVAFDWDCQGCGQRNHTEVTPEAAPDLNSGRYFAYSQGQRLHREPQRCQVTPSANPYNKIWFNKAEGGTWVAADPHRAFCAFCFPGR